MSKDTDITISYESGEGPERPMIVKINEVLNRELADPKAMGALLATTFKGLDAIKAKQAMMEGMIRGYTFEDFMKKNIYAVKFGDGYSLVTSIDDARKRGMKNGVIGKSAPIYTYKSGKPENGDNIETCEITIKRVVGQHVGEFTALVYFDEYTKGRDLWKTKPRTMIAKVAEMHALRMACPEDLSQAYVEEEFEQERVIPKTNNVIDVVSVDDDEISKAILRLEEATDHQMMIRVYTSLKPAIKLNDKIQDFISARKFEENV